MDICAWFASWMVGTACWFSWVWLIWMVVWFALLIWAVASWIKNPPIRAFKA
jgi:hypothetical protein